MLSKFTLPARLLSLWLLTAGTLGWAAEGASPATRLLFIGNSITQHGPAEAIGWSGNWGMAATAADKDYAHLVVEGLAKKLGKAPEFRLANVADYERTYESFDADTKLAEPLAFKANIVIVAIGENVPPMNTDEKRTSFRESLDKLFKSLKGDPQASLYVRSCFWPDATKDTILKEACAAAGGVFVDISKLAADEANYARSERNFAHAGVAAHPGDRGMRHIADALLAAIEVQAKR